MKLVSEILKAAQEREIQRQELVRRGDIRISSTESPMGDSPAPHQAAQGCTSSRENS